MDLQACTETIRSKVGDNSGLNATLKFDCGADGVVFVDAVAPPNTVSNENKEASCTITIALADLAALLTGQLNPMNGFMMGKLKVAGDMGVAMRLQTVV
ncbi:SCP2 sterol-binding domain-containing protein [Undibacterium sp. 14-3-2]|jgi:putative sterol carrier protein|uniref:SCP2 sterol-binding domain-containing protein n=1 Tax=Undibacterium sp. 14-3-2 TaxID=2800129 RepID=UPI001908B86D|nr:SCP2 sterol-binding domain-containing protein [Undibacterium sp. 14-3-2]MBK1891398.1 SCP2 sterol-binding domain-containing protein [Undibacterium sp. 14-3-2]